MLIVGERINSSRNVMAQAMEARDVAFIQKEAVMQVEAGANYIDVNAGAFINQESELLQWLVKTVQQVTIQPLCIDTPDSDVAAAVLRSLQGRAMINSITAERERFAVFLPLLKAYDCNVVALCVDSSRVPTTAKEKLEIASKIIQSLTQQGIAPDRIYVDPVVQPLSVDPTSAIAVFDAIEMITTQFPDVHCICGVSNISFGLPSRKQLNQIFIVLAMERGLDAAIIDPCDKQLMANIITANTLLGKDEYCLNYIKAYREEKLAK